MTMEPGIAFVHELPRNQDPESKWEMRRFYEVRLIRNRRNVFDVYVEKETFSDKIGVFFG